MFIPRDKTGARAVRLEALRLAREYGFSRGRFPLGKFEGEPIDVIYWHDAMLNGDGSGGTGYDLFDVSDDERIAFDIPEALTHAILEYSDAGFVGVDYVSAECAARIEASDVGETEY